MDVGEYKRRVIELLKSGNATDAQWDEVAECVLFASEDYDGVPHIDVVIIPGYEIDGE